MKRRDRKKLQKRKQRADRIRIERHYAQLEPAAEGEEGVEDDDFVTEEDAEFEEEAEPGLSTFLWEPAIRHARLASLVLTLPGKGDWIAARKAFDEEDARLDVIPPHADRATRERLLADRRRYKHLRKENFHLEIDSALSGAAQWREEPEETDERIEELRVLVARGPSILAERPHGRAVWDDAACRAVLRSRLNLAIALHDRGETDEARALLVESLELDRDDHTNARRTLLGFALERGDREDAANWLASLASDTSAVVVWARVLDALLGGDERQAEEALAAARRAFPGCELMFAPLDATLQDPRYDVERNAELFELVAQLGRAWKRQPKALDWVARHPR
ncbi:MAG: tetratricopeptide repeat protein [Planctomycetes bacterium]|nr:tetratricopeptide repeat protein [Planctomycetota bacterium]